MHVDILHGALYFSSTKAPKQVIFVSFLLFFVGTFDDGVRISFSVVLSLLR